MEGRHMRKPSTYNWAPQRNPFQSCWKLWTQALQPSFDIQQSNFLLRHLCLGAWLSQTTCTGWKYSPSHDSMHELVDSKWICCSTMVEQRGRGAFQRYYRRHNDLAETPPQDAINAICKGNTSRVTATGWAPFQAQNQRSSLVTLKDKCRNGPPSQVWATSLGDITVDGLCVADSIRNRDTLAVSYGSYDNDYSAAACVIEGALSHHPCILCQPTTPGPTQIHDAYQGKLT
eukprot:12419782-Ditylum_brightwellii.AAC.1